MEHNQKNKVIIGLGSNDNAANHIPRAKESLEERFHVLRWSRFKETQAIGRAKSPFLNGVALIETELSQVELKKWLQSLEDQHKRDRNDDFLVTLDLDILFWNEKMMDPTIEKKHFLKEMLGEVTNL